MKKVMGILFVLITLISFVSAQSYPEGFNGKIIVSDGSDPSGKILVGYVNGVATGSATVKSDGSFDIVVIYNTTEKELVEFYIGTIKAKETSTFSSFDVITKNLTFSEIEGVASCGNGVCLTNECSICPIDCKASDCLGNGVCDSLIGETCANAPDDCGVCLYCGDGTCNNGETCSTCSTDCGSCSSSKKSSGGGGGSSSTSSISTSSTSATNSTSEESENNSELSDLSIEALNEKDAKSGSGLGITGSSIFGFAKSGFGIGAIIVLIALSLTIGVIAIKKRNPKHENKVSS